MGGLVREVSAKLLGQGLEFFRASEQSWPLGQVLFADGMALVAGSEDKLCGLVPEFGGV